MLADQLVALVGVKSPRPASVEVTGPPALLIWPMPQTLVKSGEPGVQLTAPAGQTRPVHCLPLGVPVGTGVKGTPPAGTALALGKSPASAMAWKPWASWRPIS